jgi:hypothetical protein
MLMCCQVKDLSANSSYQAIDENLKPDDVEKGDDVTSSEFF